MTFFLFVNKKTALQLGKLEKLSHPSISILTPVLGAQKNRPPEHPQHVFNHKYGS